MKKISNPRAPLPGSQRQRQKAKRLLKAVKVNNNYWVVWGGLQSHNIKIVDDEYVCDCEKYPELCSHVIKVRMEQGDFPNYDKLYMKQA